jgi:hypothetical protein
MKAGIAWALALYVPVAHAGVAFEMSTRDLNVPDAAPIVMHGYAQNGRLRIERGENSQFVSIQTRRATIDIDTVTRSYDLRDQVELTRLGAHEKAISDQNAAREATSPASVGAMLEQMKRSSEENLALQKQDPDYRATARHEIVDGYMCSIWEYYWKGNKEQELCIAPAGVIPGGTEWMAALRGVAAFYESASQWLGDPGRLSLAPMRPEAEAPVRLGGIPLMTRSFNHGRPASESRITVVRAETLNRALFEVPKDYRRN